MNGRLFVLQCKTTKRRTMSNPNVNPAAAMAGEECHDAMERATNALFQAWGSKRSRPLLDLRPIDDDTNAPPEAYCSGLSTLLSETYEVHVAGILDAHDEIGHRLSMSRQGKHSLTTTITTGECWSANASERSTSDTQALDDVRLLHSMIPCSRFMKWYTKKIIVKLGYPSTNLVTVFSYLAKEVLRRFEQTLIEKAIRCERFRSFFWTNAYKSDLSPNRKIPMVQGRDRGDLCACFIYSLYGIRASPQHWCQTLKQTVEPIRPRNRQNEPFAFFVRESATGGSVTYVDDCCLYFGTHDANSSFVASNDDLRRHTKLSKESNHQLSTMPQDDVHASVVLQLRRQFIKDHGPTRFAYYKKRRVVQAIRSTRGCGSSYKTRRIVKSYRFQSQLQKNTIRDRKTFGIKRDGADCEVCIDHGDYCRKLGRGRLTAPPTSFEPS